MAIKGLLKQPRTKQTVHSLREEGDRRDRDEPKLLGGTLLQRESRLDRFRLLMPNIA